MTLLNALKLTSLKPQLAATMLVAGMATAQAAPLQVSHCVFKLYQRRT